MSKYVGACRTGSLLAFFHHMAPQKGTGECVCVQTCARICVCASVDPLLHVLQRA